MPKVKKTFAIGLSLAVCLAAVVVVVQFRPKAEDADGMALPAREDVPAVQSLPSALPSHPSAVPSEASEADGDEAEPRLTAEEKAEAEQERLVDAFDDLTDKWVEPVEKGVSVADVAAFVKQFDAVPKDRKEECLQRALNLIPDENVMLLVGVLMDRKQDKELVELVFNDVLNRDEDVKKPIMEQIFKDRKHPCWADVAWILDVTGETPERNK